VKKLYLLKKYLYFLLSKIQNIFSEFKHLSGISSLSWARLNLILLIYFSSFHINAQTLKAVPSSIKTRLFKTLAQDNSKCEIRVGDILTSGRILLGNPTNTNFGKDDGFVISIYELNSRNYIYFGKMKDLQIGINNFDEFIIIAFWDNNQKNEKIRFGEVKIIYSLEKSRHLSTFKDNFDASFSIQWWTEFSDSAKLQLHTLLKSVFGNEFERIRFESEKRKRFEDSILLVSQQKKRVQDSLDQVEQKVQFERKRVQDSMYQVEQQAQLERKRVQDSVTQRQNRIRDSINVMRAEEQRYFAVLQQRRADSMSLIRKRVQEEEQRRLERKQNIKLNYLGFTFGINNIEKTQELLASNAWRNISRESLAIKGEPVDGTGFARGLFLSKRIASFLGVELIFSETFDGTYYLDDEPYRDGRCCKSGSSSLFRSTIFSFGPILTIPISKWNLDFKYLYAYSRAIFTEPKRPIGQRSFITKYTSTASYNLLSAGFRFPLGRGEYISSKKIILGQLGFYYDIFDLNYKFNFGELKLNNATVSLRYFITIN